MSQDKPQAKPTHIAVGRIEVDGITYQDGDLVALSAAQAADMEARGAAVVIPKAEPKAEPAAKFK
jgi:hypothetical protein